MLEPVPAGKGKGNGAEYRKDDQEECPQRINDQCRSIEKEFQQFPEKSCTDFSCYTWHGPHTFRRPLSHPMRQFVQFVVKSLLVHQIGSLGIPFHSLHLQLVLLCPVLVHVKGLAFENRMRAFHDR